MRTSTVYNRELNIEAMRTLINHYRYCVVLDLSEIMEHTMNDVVWDVPKERQFYMFTEWTCKPPRDVSSGSMASASLETRTGSRWSVGRSMTSSSSFPAPSTMWSLWWTNIQHFIRQVVSSWCHFRPNMCKKCEYHNVVTTYRSISPGRGIWSKFGILFDQTVWFFQLFSTVLEGFCPLNSQSVLAHL